MLPKLSSPAKVDKFPGLKGYPSHFGIDVVVSDVLKRKTKDFGIRSKIITPKYLHDTKLQFFPLFYVFKTF